MINNGIEDILIGSGYNSKKKKKGKGGFILFILLILAIVVGVLYWYFSNPTVSYKVMFIENISKANASKLLEKNIYSTLYKRIFAENYELDTKVNLTTDIENEDVNELDFTKFNLEVSSFSDMEKLKVYSEGILSYSGNEIFRLNGLLTEDAVALQTNEISEKYIGANFNKFKDVFGIEVDNKKITEIIKTENLDFSEEEKEKYSKKYFEMIFNNIPEEKFSVQENIAIENALQDVAVTNYSLSLNQEELNSLIIKVLTELKEDEDLLNKFIISKNLNTVEEVINNTEVVEGEVVKENSIEFYEEQTTTQETVEQNSQETTEETTFQPVTSTVTLTPVGTITPIKEESEEKEDKKEEPILSVSAEPEIQTTNIEELIGVEKTIEDYLKEILLGKKVNATTKILQDEIEKLIKEVEKYEGNGLKVNVFASKDRIEKINIVLPNYNIVEIELFNDEDTKEYEGNYLKLTYLHEKENAEDTSEKTDGFSLEIKKSQSNASASIIAEYSFIQDEKINKKIKIDSKIEGSASSKEVKNDVIITIATNENETQIVTENSLRFTDVAGIPELNQDNCIYLDSLPEEERKTQINDITTKLTNLYTTKKDNLNFIDTNTYSSTTLENNANKNTKTVTREEAKNALISKVGNMMQEAIDNNKELTIQDLENLKIDGYKVSSAVTAEAALIVVDVYKFSIDTTFTLTDIE